ncbi:uncharacterized protein LOC125039547 isoform X2 [Penaeus chinensis]|uniref:uncharacterized protein LOC125039547 isoform X2 n=1 Tax=Penaeus chinensis TaxID=139456 RepID=UPI001FB57241|nr:uncharacterized protein LOC125039547 isoform X2 [Penaeus chinensis]
MRLNVALVFMFFGTVSCLQILDECMPRKRLETYIKGNEMKLRVWVPEIGDASLLTLISENGQTGILRKIEIRKNVTTIRTKDEETVRPEFKLPIQNSLPHGWVNFMVTSNENFTVTVPDVNLTLIDVQDVVQDQNIIITGSNVTANCRLPTNQWEVFARQEAVIPLSPNGSHDFSLFSRAPFTPELAVALDSRERLSFPSLSRVFESESQQMSPFSLYNFTLNCAIDEKRSSCYIQAGDSKVLEVYFFRNDTSLSLIASGMDGYIIVQGTRNNQEGGLKVEDQNGDGPVITVRRAIIATTASLVAIVSIYIFIKCKRKSRA